MTKELDIKDFIYIISDEFDYNKVISAAAGYRYAEDMGFAYDTLSNINQHLDQIIIVDNRLTKKDCTLIRTVVEDNKETNFMFKIVDPHEVTIGHYLKMLFELADYPNVKYLSTYTFAGNTKKLFSKVGPKRMVHIPYAFNPNKIVDNSFSKRKNKIILSGAKFKNLYPLRRRMMKGIFRFFSIRLRLYTDVLPHPGYPDIGDQKKHNLIGTKYLEFLSSYKFMLVTTSIYDSEFLKFNECAYAGCVPVGVASSCLPEEAKKNMFHINVDGNIGRQVKKIVTSKMDLDKMATKYRESMLKNRNKETLHKMLFNFISNEA